MELYTGMSIFFTEAHNKLIDLVSNVASNIELKDSGDMNWIYNLEHIKYIGAMLVVNDVCNCLKIIKCNLEKNLRHIKVPNNLFSWYFEHFIERTKMHDTRYINDFITEHRNDIDMIKLKVDVETILDLIESFSLDTTRKNKLQVFDEKLRAVFKLLKLQGSILAEKTDNEIVANALHLQMMNFNVDLANEMAEYDEALYNIRTEYYETKLIKFPIQLRYVNKYETARINQLAKVKENEDNVYIFEIRDSKNKYIREQNCFEHLTSAYEIETERMKAKVDEVIAHYEMDYEIYELDLSRTRGTLEEINGEIKKHHEQYEFYKSEIVRHKAEQEAMEAEKAWRAQIEALGGEEEQVVEKTKKGKKKGKGKKGGKAKMEKTTTKTAENTEKKDPKKKSTKK